MWCDHDINVSRDFVGGVPSFLVTTLKSSGSTSLMELEKMAFAISVPILILTQCRGSNAEVYK